MEFGKISLLHAIHETDKPNKLKVFTWLHDYFRFSIGMSYIVDSEGGSEENQFMIALEVFSKKG